MEVRLESFGLCCATRNWSRLMILWLLPRGLRLRKYVLGPDAHVGVAFAKGL